MTNLNFSGPDDFDHYCLLSYPCHRYLHCFHHRLLFPQVCLYFFINNSFFMFNDNHSCPYIYMHAYFFQQRWNSPIKLFIWNKSKLGRLDGNMAILGLYYLLEKIALFKDNEKYPDLNFKGKMFRFKLPMNSLWLRYHN